MKKIILLNSLLLYGWIAVAQQDPLYSQYMLNPFLLNPAYSGLTNNFNAMAGYRTQWTGYEGHPQTFFASAHTSLVDNKVGTGILFINDRLGSMATTEANINFAYKLNFSKSTFSFGMRTGILSYESDYSNLNLYDPNDVAFTGNTRGTSANLGAGVIIKSEKYFIGLSVPRLLPTTFKNSGQEFELYNQHFYLQGSYVHYVNENIRFKPSVLLRGVKGAPLSADIAFNININALYTAGVFTRNFGTYGFLIQALVKEKFRFGYVFELPTNKSVGSQFTTHELAIGIQLATFRYHDRSLGNF
jgi:type IX secretion system PorP/SprF family membrane protein